MAAVVVLAGSTASIAGLPLELVAQSGVESAFGPGVEAGTTFATFNAPVVDPTGRLVFSASTAGPNMPAGGLFGVWMHDAGVNTLAIRTSDLSPFTGAAIGSFGAQPNTGDGDATITTFEEGLVHVGGVTSTLLHTLMEPPGTGPGVFFGFPENLLTNGVGTYAFRNNMTGAVTADDFTGVFAGTPGALSLVIRQGDGAPDLPGLSLVGINSLRMAKDGALAFEGALDGPGVTASNLFAIWAGLPGSFGLVVRTGDNAPGMPAGAVFSDLGFGANSVPNSTGAIVVKATTTGGGVTSADDEGLWVGGPGALALALREGDQAPELPAGVLIGSFQSVFTNPAIDSSERVTTRVRLTGAGVTTDDWDAVYWGAPGAMRLVARSGEAAPEAPGLVLSSISQVVSNDAGHVLLSASLTDGLNFEGVIYVWHESTGLTLVVREGDEFDFGGDIGTIANMEFASSEFDGAGLASGLGDDGTIAFRATAQPIGNVVFRAQAPGAGNPFDLTGDGVVDGADLGLLLGAWGPCPGCPADFNGDGAVDGADLGLLLGAWG
jgi:hypothetical protein